MITLVVCLDIGIIRCIIISLVVFAWKFEASRQNNNMILFVVMRMYRNYSSNLKKNSVFATILVKMTR